MLTLGDRGASRPTSRWRVTGRNALKRGYFRTLELGGLQRLLLRRRAADGSLLVINLHRVSPHGNPFDPPMHPSALDELAAFLSRRCHVTLFGALPEGRVDATRPSVIVSFDDGLRDFVEYALPVLERHRLAVNHNVIAGCVETGVPPWNLRLTDLLAGAPPALLARLRTLDLPVSLSGTSDDARLRFGLQLRRHLKQRPRSWREELFAEIERVLGDAEVARPTEMLGPDEVAELAKEHEIGSHSYSHESMAWESDEFFTADFDRAQAALSGLLGAPPSVYAFPNGSFREGQPESLLARGIRHVLLSEERPSSVECSVHRRITLYGDSGPELRLRALGHRPLAV